MKILVVTNMYPSEKSKTFGIFVKNQVDALRKHKQEVDVVAITEPKSSKVITIVKYLKWLFQLIGHLLTKGWRYDVVHAHYVFPSGLLALLFKKIFKTKMIVTAHGGDIDRMAKKNKYIYKATKYILQTADEVIVVGEKLAEDVTEDFNIDKGKVHVISMGVNREIFQPINKNIAKKSVNIASEIKIILFVGNLIKEKGVLELVEAYKKIVNKNKKNLLVIIGSKKHELYFEQLEKEISFLPEGKVILLPPVAQTDLATWMNAADVFVLPSYMEGLGLVAVEAMACHTPVVASDVGGLSYLLSEEAGILIPSKDIASLYEGICGILEDEKKSQFLVNNGELVAQKHDQKQVISQLLELYQKQFDEGQVGNNKKKY